VSSQEVSKVLPGLGLNVGESKGQGMRNIIW
jgi:hypothetical protein